jgi:hypothetical protein
VNDFGALHYGNRHGGYTTLVYDVFRDGIDGFRKLWDKVGETDGGEQCCEECDADEAHVANSLDIFGLTDHLFFSFVGLDVHAV